MRVVVSGATGNVGTALLGRLLGAGHEVVGVVRRPPDDARPYEDADWVTADLASDSCLGPLRAAFAGADAVVHLAWGFQPSHDLDYLAELGVGGTRRVLAALAAGGPAHLVHMSSVGAYSPKRDDEPVDESWPTAGVPTSPYSRHKAAAERLLDDHAVAQDRVTITRMRPGIIGQAAAASALLRYALPAILPARALDLLPVLPLDRRLTVPMVHADDVADAVVRVLEARAPGAFNLAADGSITTADIAGALGARTVHVPAPVVRAVVAAAWHARLQPVDPGWVDLGFSVPLLDTARARTELGWSPRTDARSVLRETLDAMRRPEAGDSDVLRRRSVADGLRRLAERGPVTRRRRP
jgi:nucleoside-diphosphate-sugar epimerase